MPRGPRATSVALRWLGRDGRRARPHVRASSPQTEPLRERARRPRRRHGRPRLRARRSHPRALRRGARHAQARRRVLAALLRVRPRADRARVALGAAHACSSRPQALYEKKVAPIRGASRRSSTCSSSATRLGDCRARSTFGALLADGEPDASRSRRPTPRTPRCSTSRAARPARRRARCTCTAPSSRTTSPGTLALDLHPDDIFWCTADPGWVTGTSYGIIAPLTHGVTMIVDEAEFDAERWYDILERRARDGLVHGADRDPHADAAGAEPARTHDLSRLRFVASVGEPLNPEAVVWGVRRLGRPFHDNWWQTETGGIMIANFASMDDRPARWASRCPASTAAIVRADGEAAVVEITEPDVEGELALRPGWPSMFRGYLGEPERYAKCFAGGWYLTGDLARRDADGYFWFVGRADDVIKTAGHLIGPFEVESALLEHPAVAEAGVIGKPDPVAGEIVKAFVSLKPGFTADRRRSRSELLGVRAQAARRRRRAEGDRVRRALPRTRSGKIMRRLLKARELGLPEGDTSTLEARAMTHRRHRDARARPAAADAAASAASRRSAPSSTRRRRSAASCTSTSARRRSPSGAMPALARRRRGRRDLPRARPRARARHAPRRRDGGDVRQGQGLRARSRRLDAPRSTSRGASTAATRSSAAGCRSRSASRSRTRCSGRSARDRLLLRRRRDGRGRVPRVAQPRRAVEAAGALPLREQPVRDGHRARAPRSRSPISRRSRRRYGIPAERVDGMDVLAVERRTRAAADAIRARRDAALPRAPRPTASARTRCSTPSATATRTRSSAGSSAIRSTLLRPAARATACSTTQGAPRSSATRWRSSRPRSREADAAPLEPIETLARDVYTHELIAMSRGHVPRGRLRRRCARRCSDDPRVFLMGEDVGRYGGAYAVQPRPARGVRTRARPRHAALGVDLRRRGHRRGDRRHAADRRDHDGELQPARARSDREQRGDAAAHVRRAVRVPLVIRMATGAGRQLAAQHSHSLENWYAHVPGPQGARARRRRRTRATCCSPRSQDPDPVHHLRAPAPLRGRRASSTTERAVEHAWHAAVRTGRARRHAHHLRRLAAARRCAPPRSSRAEGIEAEVIDLRVPASARRRRRSRESVARTHRVVVVDEGWKTGSLAAEIVAHDRRGRLLRARRAARARVQSPRCRSRTRSTSRTRRCPSVDAIVEAARRS